MRSMKRGSWMVAGTAAASLVLASAASGSSAGAQSDMAAGMGTGAGSGSGSESGSGSGSTSASGSGAGSPVASDAGAVSLPDSGAARGDGGLSLTQRTQAVDATTTSNPLCTALGDFCWEIGDATGTLGSGAVGTTYSAMTSIAIASASKFVFGAYMIQSTGGNLTPTEEQALRMLSGYYGLDPSICGPTPTVSACLAAGTPGPNYSYDAAYIGSFYYGGAHDEYLAANSLANGGLGIGSYTTDKVNSLIMPVILNPGFKYAFPEFAGGHRGDPLRVRDLPAVDRGQQASHP